MKATMLLPLTAISGILIMNSGQIGVSQPSGNLSYSAKCETCHDKAGLANTSAGKLFHMRPFTDPTVLAMSDSALQDAIVNGSGKMPAFKGKLSNAEITNLIQYIHKLQTSP